MIGVAVVPCRYISVEYGFLLVGVVGVDGFFYLLFWTPQVVLGFSLPDDSRGRIHSL